MENKDSSIGRIIRYLKLIYSAPHSFFIILLLSVSAFLEVAGLSLLVPTLTMLLGGNIEDDQISSGFHEIFDYVGLPLSANILLFCILGLLISSYTVKYMTSVRMESARKSITAQHRIALLKSHYGARWEAIIEGSSGEFNNYFTRETALTGDLVFFGFQGVVAIVYSLAYLALLLYLSWRVTLIVVSFYAAISFLNDRLAIWARRYAKLSVRAYNALGAQLVDRMRAIKFIVSSSLQNETIASIAKISDATLVNDFKNRIIRHLSANVTALFSLVLVIALIFMIRASEVSAIYLLVVLFISRQLTPKINEVLKAYQVMTLNMVHYDEVLKRVEFYDSQKQRDGFRAIDTLKSLEIKKISFQYQNGRPLFEDLNLSISVNRTTAIVGGSGAGKSTLVDLVMGLVEAPQGSILINGYPLAEVNKQDWRLKIGYVSQESVLFNSTLRENVTIRKPDATDVEIHKVCSDVALDQFIQSLPKGYDTEIGENGIKLSGGQRQRIALARALIVHPQLLILDEATSFLDVESEAAIQSALESIHGLLTVIVIAHRLSTVKSADIIHVLENGKVIESGSYHTLLKLKGRFYQFDQLAYQRD
ncbi:ABC transporter ATP-binding protein/permease [Acidobacteria bacterium AH-259-A15]|nr:ABC transporter ATP-binding protein/permease [Acidobacteria bacterium AH-259-A15]